MPSKGDWSEVRDACCVPPPTRALIPPVGDEQGRRVIPEKARLMATVGQCHDPPNRSTHCIVVRRAPTAKHGTSTCHPSKHQTRSSHDSLFSPRLAFHERGATPTFVWRSPLLSCLGDVWWRLPSTVLEDASPCTPSLSTERATDAACGRETHAPSFPALCYLVFILIAG